MTFLFRQLVKLSARHAAILFVVVRLGPLVLLTWTSLTVADGPVRREVEARIHQVFADAGGASGYRGVHAQLERDGVEAGPSWSVRLTTLRSAQRSADS